MNTSEIEFAVFNQLNRATGLQSLKIQNHIYGCFLIMEDIAQRAVTVTDYVISGSNFSFDLDKQFSEIGMRYGFAMDSKLAIDTFKAEYKTVWLKYFKEIGTISDIGYVDTIEDALIDIIQKIVPKDEAFFINATNTGTLSQEWITKVIGLLQTSSVVPPSLSVEPSVSSQVPLESSRPPSAASQAISSPLDQDEQPVHTAISDANTEKPISHIPKPSVLKHNRLATTRRVNKVLNQNKKKLARTRRH